VKASPGIASAVLGRSLYLRTAHLAEEKQEIYRALMSRVMGRDGQVERVELRV